MATVREALGEANAGVFARLVQKISNSLLTGGYRHDSAAWDPLQESEGRPLDVLPPDAQVGESRKPYFEVLVVTPNDPEHLGARAQRIEAPAPPGRSFSLRDRAGR